MRKYIVFFLLSLTGLSTTLTAEVPYDSYIYNRWQETVWIPHTYVPRMVLYGEDLDLSELNSPHGLYVQKDSGELFIADSGNGRIIRVSPQWEVLSVYEGFKDPQDIFVSPGGIIYVADSGNSRIVLMDLEGNFLRILGPPESDLIPKDFVYYPMKLVVDKAERIYVVAQGVNEGLIELDRDGLFKGFFGASKVAVEIGEYLWKYFSTEEQRKSMRRFVPTVYNNLELDEDGFLFVTTSAVDPNQLMSAILWNMEWDKVTPVRRLNPKGEDILHRDDWFPPLGDVRFIAQDSSTPGPSAFGDLALDPDGIYHVLDTRRGRVFTYDPDGILLNIFGGMGSRKGLFRSPSAIALFNEDILILDSINNSISVFALTEYGRTMQRAIKDYFNGKYDASLEGWQRVIMQNINFEWAYWGIGNALYMNDKFKESMEYFKTIRYGGAYSRSFKYYRKEVMEKIFGYVVMGILVFIIGIRILFRWYRKRARGQA